MPSATDQRGVPAFAAPHRVVAGHARQDVVARAAIKPVAGFVTMQAIAAAGSHKFLDLSHDVTVGFGGPAVFPVQKDLHRTRR